LIRFTAACVLLLWATPAHAQVPTTDAANTFQAGEMAAKILKELENALVIAQHLTRAAKGNTDMGRFLTTGIPMVRHDVSRYPNAADFLTGLNQGDDRGVRYMRSVRTLAEWGPMLARMPAAMRNRMIVELAQIEIRDSINERGVHLSGQLQTVTPSVQRAIANIQADVIDPRTAKHYTTTVLEKSNAANLVSSQLAEMHNMALSSILEAVTAQTTRDRNTKVATMNRRITAYMGGQAANDEIVADATVAIENWRQP
jgi:hypothetical protein